MTSYLATVEVITIKRSKPSKHLYFVLSYFIYPFYYYPKNLITKNMIKKYILRDEAKKKRDYDDE